MLSFNPDPQKTRWQAAYTGIGSRETPTDVCQLFHAIGYSQCARGWVLRSGGADGADEAFYQGAIAYPGFCSRAAEIFIPWNGFKRTHSPPLYHDPERGIYDASRFDAHEEARALALQARGSFEGLGQGGIRLHTRNAYQVLGRTLSQPSRSLVCWAQPIGRKGAVKGGTNTAVQIALRHGIRVLNAYKDVDRRLLEEWVKTHNAG